MKILIDFLGKSPEMHSKKYHNFTWILQHQFESYRKIMIKLARSIREEYNIKNLCLAGGVALNCVANGKILKEKIFENIWIQPAAGDAGGSVGAALALWYIEDNNQRKLNSEDDMQGSYLGPEFTQNEIEEQLKLSGAKFETLSYDNLMKTAENLSKQKL